MLHCMISPTTVHVIYCHVVYVFVDKCTTKSYYYLGFLYSDHGGSESFVLTTTDSQPVNYSIYIPRHTYRDSGTITINNSVTLSLRYNMEVSSYTHIDYGIYLETSSDKVTVIGQNYDSSSSDTYLALPTIKSQTATEYTYYAMSVYSPNSYSSILIVATEDSTEIKLEVTQSTTVYYRYYYGWRYGHAYDYTLSPGNQLSITFNKLQTRYMEMTSDLSGTKIIANKPVSVFSGHRCAYVPYSNGNCGYLIEQIPPTTSWGTTYYVAPLATRKFYSIKVLAAHDNTNVTMYCNGTAQDYSLNEKGHTTRTLDNQEYCTIHANKKVLVAQFSGKNGEDPSMTLIPATNDFKSRFQFPTFHHPSDSYYYPTIINIIVMAQYYQPESIYVVTGGSKRALNKQKWRPFIVNNITEAYSTKLPVLHGVVEIVHTDITALMTAIVYGVAARNGYMHPGGFSSTVGK